jgi:flap endonuclease-1
VVGMGVDIGSLFNMKTVSFKDLHNRIIVIDAYNVLHQFLSIIRQRDGTLLKDSEGKITSHLSGLLYRTGSLIENRIRPVYIFDGKPPLLKEKTIEIRKQRKIKAEKEWKDALEKGDLETARSKAQQTSRVTEGIMTQSIQLLTALGIPYLHAPSEGEAQASYIVKKGDAYAVGSQDFDCLLVGTPVLIRNLTASTKRKLPGKKAYTSIHPQQIQLKPNLRKLGITHKQLVDMAILIGTDFNTGIKGIGPKKSLSLIKKNGNVENVLSTIGGDDAPTFEEIKEIRKIFLEPTVTDDYEFSWSKPDLDQVYNILCEQHQFKKDRVDAALKKYESMETMAKQQTLF